MSASTAEAIDESRKNPDDWDAPDDPVEYMVWLRARRGAENKRSYKRIIDLEKGLRSVDAFASGYFTSFDALPYYEAPASVSLPLQLLFQIFVPSGRATRPRRYKFSPEIEARPAIGVAHEPSSSLSIALSALT